jgi:hypothetical protein
MFTARYGLDLYMKRSVLRFLDVKRLVNLIDTDYVLCDLRTEMLYATYLNDSVKF